MATKVNYSDLSAPNYKTTIRVGTSKTTLLFGDYGSCYGEYDEPIAINNNSMNPVSTVDSTELIINYFSYHSPTTNGIVLAGKKFTTDTPAGYIKFTSHGKTMIINVTIIGEAVEKNIEFNDSLNNNYTVRVEDISNCSLKLYYIYYEGKDSNGNWKPVTPTSNVLKTISLTFEKIGTVSYKDDKLSLTISINVSMKGSWLNFLLDEQPSRTLSPNPTILTSSLFFNFSIVLEIFVSLYVGYLSKLGSISFTS